MSVWTHIQGNVSIYKKDNVSIKKVVCDTLTDEAIIDIKTEDRIDHYHHVINGRVCLDGYEFIHCYKEFLEALKPMKGGLYLICELRFYS